MAKRTIAEARSLLESTVLPNANPYWTERYRRFLEDAEGRAKVMASERAEAEASSIADAIHDAQRELADLRDAYEELARDADLIPATDYAKQLADLRKRESAATSALSRLDERTDALDRLEADPIEWFDSMARRIPSLRVDVPW